MWLSSHVRLQVSVAAGVANLVADLALILQLRMGISGAALGTTAAQWAGALFFLGYLRRQVLRRCQRPFWRPVCSLMPICGTA